MLSGFFVTKKGKNLLAKTHDGAHIQLTRAEIGNGDVPEDQLVTDVTQLYGKIKELPLRDVRIAANDTACVPVQFSNKGVLTSFELREVGIYALDPDEGEILYLYGNTSATGDKPDEIKGESEAPLEYLFNLNLTFDNGKDVKVTVDNGIIYATVQELLDMADTKVDKVDGKGLSTEDYATAEKNKLAGIEAGANKYVHPATHPVSMITGLGTAATKDVGTAEDNVVGVNSDGKIDSTLIGSLAQVGTDGYIAYPGGGWLNTKVRNQLGMLKITLPVSWNETMLKFRVSIFSDTSSASVDYIIAGYSNTTPNWSRTTAYCVSPWGGSKSNLPVSFGHDGTKCAITIGTSTTEWNYPHVVISDVSLGYDNIEYDIWKSGWNISFVTEALPTVSATISNTNIAYNVNHADSAATLTDLTATVAELNYVDSVTSNIQTQLNGKAANGHTHTPTDITLTGGLADDIDPITRQSIGSARSNKSYGLPASAITVEYSRDGGTTWIDYGLTDTEKTRLFDETRSKGVYLGKSSDKTHTTQYMLRVTIIPEDRYCTFDGVYHWISTNGNGVRFKLERSTVGAKTTFTTVLDNQTLSGWAGNNIYYFPKGLFGSLTDGTIQPNNNYAYRLTYWMTTIKNDQNAALIYDIRFLGPSVHIPPSSGGIQSNMVVYGTPYSCNPATRTTTFPGTVSATNFDGTVTKVANKLTIGSKAYDGSAAVTITAADVPGLGTAATKNTGTSAGQVPIIQSGGKLPASIIPPDNTKVDKVTGKNLSTEDFTTAEKNKLARLTAGAAQIVSAISTDGVSYTATNADVTVDQGTVIVLVPNRTTASTSVTLNLNGSGAKRIYQTVSISSGENVTPKNTSWLTADKPVLLLYDGTAWRTVGTRASASDLYGTITADNIDLSGKLPFVRSVSYNASSYTTSSSATTVSAYNLDIPAEDITSTSDIIINVALAVSSYGTSSTSETNYASYYMYVYNDLTTLDSKTQIVSRQQFSGSNNLDWTNSSQYMYTPAVFSYVIHDYSANTPIAVRISHCRWTGTGSYIFHGTVSALIIPK